MTDIEQVSEEARAIATEASKEGKFSFLDRLAGREYPTEDVEIYIDERAGHKINQYREALKHNTDAEKESALLDAIEKEREKAKRSRYIVHIEGISVEEWDATVDAANEAYPVQYEEVTHPLTMAKQKIAVPDERREVYFRTHIWAKFIRSVTGPDGEVDDDITPEWVAVFAGQAPIIALAKVQYAIDKSRMTTEWMDQIQTDDFLVKS